MISLRKISRTVTYIRKKGFINAVKHFFYILKRDIFQNRFILYYMDLHTYRSPQMTENDGYKFKVVCNEDQVSDEEMQKLIKGRGGKVLRKCLKKRFIKGANAWFLYKQNSFVGFIWTIQNIDKEACFIPLAEKDIHLFDNEVFEKYRGKGINSIILDKTLSELKTRGLSRAYIETGIWNKKERKSLAKNNFEKVAIASNRYLFGKNITIWRHINNYKMEKE